MPTGILGLGHAVPSAVRGNEDPIFDTLRAGAPPGADLFTGYRERRVLAPSARLVDLIAEAARVAIDRAGVGPGDIDLLLGCASLGEYTLPSELAALHHALALPSHACVLPLGNEFSNFSAGLVVAEAMIRAGRAQTALVACGTDWTRRMDYATAPSVSAGDGAGAAVVGEAARPPWTVVGFEVETASRYFGSMVVREHFEMNAQGRAGFQEFGLGAPVALALRLLGRHAVAPAQVSLVSHQASRVLLDAWRGGIQPAEHLETLEAYGNMTAASLPFNLSFFVDRIAQPYALLLGVGPEMHASALLLRRG